MRDIMVAEVDVGCDCCTAEKETSEVGVGVIAGIMLGLARHQVSFCSMHLKGFKNAIAGMEASAAEYEAAQRQSAAK